MNRTRWISFVVATLATFVAADCASAAPIAGTLNAKYWLEASRLVSNMDTQLQPREAGVKLLQGGMEKSSGEKSPLAFNLPDDVATTATVTTEIPLLKVGVADGNNLGVAYTVTTEFAAPLAPGMGARAIDVDLGSTDSLFGDTRRQARAFELMNILGTGNALLKAVGENPMTQVKAVYPYTGADVPGANFFAPTKKTIFVRNDDRVLDWDVMLHEFGHFAQNEYGFFPAAGGPHFFGKEGASEALAFNEGFSTFFGLLAQPIDPTVPAGRKYVGDTDYTDSKGDFTVQIERNDWTYKGKTDFLLSRGAKDELGVARWLWDAVDDTPMEKLDDRGNGTKLDKIAMTPATMWGLLKETGEKGYSTLISKATFALANAQIGNPQAQIEVFRNMGNLNQDHGFGATVGGVKVKPPATPALEAGVQAATAPGENLLEFDWSTILAGVDETPPELVEEDVVDDAPGTTVSDPNFAAFKLAFFDENWLAPLAATGWIDATSSLLSYTLDTDKTNWNYVLEPAVFSTLKNQLAALGTDRFGWTVITDSLLGDRPEDVLEGIWGTQGLSSLSVPEPRCAVLAALGFAELVRRRRRERRTSAV